MYKLLGSCIMSDRAQVLIIRVLAVATFIFLYFALINS